MSHLFLFAQVPVNSRFRFENADAGKIFVKSSEAGAHLDGAYQPVNPDVLVFPVPDRIVSAEFRTSSSNEWFVIETPFSKQWALLNKNDNRPAQFFNSLEDVIHHLEGV